MNGEDVKGGGMAYEDTMKILLGGTEENREALFRAAGSPTEHSFCR
jgi:hypothetical protein